MTREEKINILKSRKEEAEIDGYFGFATALDSAIKALEQEPNTWSLNDAREDFMSDVYNTLDFLPTNEEANRIIDSFDRVTSNIKQEPILDKIYADIQRLRGCSCSCSDGIIDDVEDILDKYKAESEG